VGRHDVNALGTLDPSVTRRDALDQHVGVGIQIVIASRGRAPREAAGRGVRLGKGIDVRAASRQGDFPRLDIRAAADDHVRAIEDVGIGAHVCDGDESAAPPVGAHVGEDLGAGGG